LTRTASARLHLINFSQPVNYLRHCYEETLPQYGVGNVSQLFAEQYVDTAQPKVSGRFRKLDF
jgi:hypothetical protein